MMKLDSYQQKVIDANLVNDSVLRVVANAGAGKSTTMLFKAQSLIEEGTSPSSIVVISFSRKSRLDLQEKWKKNHSSIKPPIISTLHSLGLSILTKYLKVDSFKLLHLHEQNRIIKQLLSSAGLNADNKESYAILSEISYYKSCNIPISEIRKGDHQSKVSLQATFSQFLNIYTKYDSFCIKNGYYDFDDLVYRTFHLLLAKPFVLKAIREIQQTYIIDESQDLNIINWELIMLLSRNLRMISVGDPCQNIYTFRHAKPEYFSTDFFKKHFTTVKNLQLPYNYRSPADIVELGNVIRKLNKNRLVAIPVKTKTNCINFKTIKQSNGEGTEVVRIVDKLVSIGYKYSDITVICRATAHLNNVIENKFIETDIPYQILAGNSLSFHESTSISIFIKMISILLDKNDLLSWTSLIPFANNMGVYKRTKRGSETLSNASKLFINTILSTQKPIVNCGTLKQASMLKAFYSSIIALNINFSRTSFEILLNNLNDLHLKYIQECYQVKITQFPRIKNTFMNFINDYFETNENANIKEAIAQLILNVDSYDTESNKQNKVTLSTIHGQKGLESKVTIACGFRSFKQNEDLGDELNMLYVQLSRASEKLIVVRSQTVRKTNASVIDGAENKHIVEVVNQWNLANDGVWNIT